MRNCRSKDLETGEVDIEVGSLQSMVEWKHPGGFTVDKFWKSHENGIKFRYCKFIVLCLPLSCFTHTSENGIKFRYCKFIVLGLPPSCLTHTSQSILHTHQSMGTRFCWRILSVKSDSHFRCERDSTNQRLRCLSLNWSSCHSSSLS